MALQSLLTPSPLSPTAATVPHASPLNATTHAFDIYKREPSAAVMGGTVTKNSANKQSSAKAKGLCARRYLRGQGGDPGTPLGSKHSPDQWVKGVGHLPDYISSVPHGTDSWPAGWDSGRVQKTKSRLRGLLLASLEVRLPKKRPSRPRPPCPWGWAGPSGHFSEA